MSWTTFIVEFNTAAPGEADSWQDISQYVRNISTSYGRSSELDEFSAGTFTITLNNIDRRFDPLYAAGPYFGSLLPMKPIRIRVQSPLDGPGTTTYIATGFILGWQQSYDYQAGDAEVELNCVDGTYLLSSTRVGDSFWSTYVRNVLQPAHWYRLYEPSGSSIAIDEAGSRFNGEYIGSVTLGTAVSNDRPPGATCATFDGTGWAQLPLGLIDPAGPWTIQLIVNVSSVNNPAVAIFSLGDALIWDYVVGSSTLFIFGSGTHAVLSGTMTTNAWHTVTVTFDGTTMQLYIDNVLRDTDTAVDPYDLGELTPTYIGNSINDSADWRFKGSVHNLVMFDYVLSADQINTLSTLYFLGSITTAVGTTIGYLLDMANWDAGARLLDSGRDLIQPPTDGGRSALDVIKQLVLSEGGVFFVSPAGNATFFDRWAPQQNATQSAVWATFDDVGALRYVEATPVLDDQYIYNQISVSRHEDGSVEQTSVDFTSQAKYGFRSKELSDLLLSSDIKAKAYADFLLARYKEPITRLPELVVDARYSDAVMDKCLKIELRYQIRVKRVPQSIGTAWQVDNLVEGIRHDIDLEGRTWTTTYSLSPVDTTSYMVIGDSTLGKIGTGKAGF